MLRISECRVRVEYYSIETLTRWMEDCETLEELIKFGNKYDDAITNIMNSNQVEGEKFLNKVRMKALVLAFEDALK